MSDKPLCVFRFEAGPDQPCWGEIEAHEDDADGDPFYACVGHYGWSIRASHAWNREHYTYETDGKYGDFGF